MLNFLFVLFNWISCFHRNLLLFSYQCLIILSCFVLLKVNIRMLHYYCHLWIKGDILAAKLIIAFPPWLYFYFEGRNLYYIKMDNRVSTRVRISSSAISKILFNIKAAVMYTYQNLSHWKLPGISTLHFNIYVAVDAWSIIVIHNYVKRKETL